MKTSVNPNINVFSHPLSLCMTRGQNQNQKQNGQANPSHFIYKKSMQVDLHLFWIDIKRVRAA